MWGTVWACALAGVALVVPTSAHAAPATQPVVVLYATKPVRAAPDGSVVGSVNRFRPIHGGRTTLPVLATRRDADGRLWYRVLLPGRPNGHMGWISAAGTRQGAVGWRVAVSIARREAVVYRLGRVARRFRVIVGAPSTPTPAGHFFVEEVLREPGDFPGAPYALALSARSTVLQEFDGGPGQIALHGVENVGGRLGTAASHGCVRFGTAADIWLGRHLPRGTPVDITR
ncbi:MAG TPA: L,D-transpeptidase [Solirubrobacteraceae bacterium]|nr:L,D-transpeptidase [Solirubrobacteraceae bacterium]